MQGTLGKPAQREGKTAQKPFAEKPFPTREPVPEVKCDLDAILMQPLKHSIPSIPIRLELSDRLGRLREISGHLIELNFTLAQRFQLLTMRIHLRLGERTIPI